ncbi:MAG: cytochrome c maturation protein CcmE [Pseudomonadota bacterium]
MTPRRQRMLAVALLLLGAGTATALGLVAARKNFLYFYSPTQIVQGEAPADRRVRVGGMVIAGSVEREAGSLEVSFALTDTAENVRVTYAGILPDLFREGQGIIVHGMVDPVSGTVVADEVLAKHDESYMPPEVAASMKTAREAQAE